MLGPGFVYGKLFLDPFTKAASLDGLPILVTLLFSKPIITKEKYKWSLASEEELKIFLTDSVLKLFISYLKYTSHTVTRYSVYELFIKTQDFFGICDIIEPSHAAFCARICAGAVGGTISAFGSNNIERNMNIANNIAYELLDYYKIDTVYQVAAILPIEILTAGPFIANYFYNTDIRFLAVEFIESSIYAVFASFSAGALYPRFAELLEDFSASFGHHCRDLNSYDIEDSCIYYEY